MDFQPFEPVSWPPPKPMVTGIVEHINQTGEPETAPGLHKGPISKTAPFLIVRDISVPRERRPDGAKAPCPMCQPNKFFEGKLVWLTEVHALAVIGHCCAASETRLAAEREFREREARERAVDYLLDRLPSLPELRKKCHDLEGRVTAAQEVHDHFRADGAGFQRTLRRATKNDGRLTVEEVIGKLDQDGPSGRMAAGSTVQTRQVTFGILAGRAAIAENCRVLSEFERAHENLHALPYLPCDDAILSFLASLEDEPLLRYGKALREGIEGLAGVERSLDDLAAFFTRQNARRITEWGAHHDAPDYLRANFGPYRLEGRHLFEIVGGSGRRVGILIPAAFWPNGRRPPDE